MWKAVTGYIIEELGFFETVQEAEKAVDQKIESIKDYVRTHKDGIDSINDSIDRIIALRECITTIKKHENTSITQVPSIWNRPHMTIGEHSILNTPILT